jgi:hypothetical protein
MSDISTDFRLDRLEEDMRAVKATLSRLETMVVRIEATLLATLPHLATKAELAEKPGKTFLVGSIAVLLAAYALGLAGLAAMPAIRTLWGG